MSVQRLWVLLGVALLCAMSPVALASFAKECVVSRRGKSSHGKSSRTTTQKKQRSYRPPEMPSSIGVVRSGHRPSVHRRRNQTFRDSACWSCPTIEVGAFCPRYGGLSATRRCRATRRRK